MMKRQKASASREVKEETGIEIKNIRKAGFTHHRFEGFSKHYMTLEMTAEHASGEPELKKTDKSACWKWFD